MDWSLAALWLTALAAVGGVIFTIVRNSRSVARKNDELKKKDDELQTELKGEINYVKARLDDPVYGLSAIKKAVDNQGSYCTKVSTRLALQAESHDSAIKELKKRKMDDGSK